LIDLCSDRKQGSVFDEAWVSSLRTVLSKTTLLPDQKNALAATSQEGSRVTFIFKTGSFSSTFMEMREPYVG
jgi:hypothetical protein